MSWDNLSLGAIGTSRFSGQRGRTADGTNRGGVRYPSPFFDIGHTYLPPSMKALMRWCRYYYLVNPLINTVITKMAEYPITETIIDEKNAKIKEKWENLLGLHLRYRPYQIEVGLDYFTYGICLNTINFPFDKYLVCGHCGHKHLARKTNYKWRNLDYIIQCKSCQRTDIAKVQDYYVRDVRRIRLMRWNPEYIHIDEGAAGADPIYTFEIPLQLRNDILLGKKNVLDTIPDVYVEAMRRNKFIRFSPDNIFVFKRPIISQKDNGWGMPLIFPVLKDSFYLQILRKAQEAIASEHIVPLRVLFPQAGSATSDPYTSIDLSSWKGRIEQEIARWKYDANYIPILPLPIGSQTIGGDGKALGLYQEMDVWSKQIVAGMGVPQEFVFGGMQYSGSNVSLRMVENMFLGYRTDHELMLNQFVIRRVAAYMGWPIVQAHMSRFKMADDLQRSAFYSQLSQAQTISEQTLLQEVGFDPVVEEQRKNTELNRKLDFNRKMQIAQAGIQGEMLLTTTKYQVQAQKMQAEVQQEQMAQQQQQMAQQQMAAGGAQPGAAQTAQQQQPGAEQQASGMPSGAEGEMIPGQQADMAMPQNSTVSPQNAQQAPAEGTPPEMQSPLTMGMTGGGYNLLYLAKRAAAALSQLDEAAKYTELDRMRMSNPGLYAIVLKMIQHEHGSQANPLNPLQSPLPQQRPTRRAAAVA